MGQAGSGTRTPRPFPDGKHRDADGDVWLIVPVMDWDAYVHLAFEEIRLAGAASPQVTRRLRAALDDLRTVAPPHRRQVIDAQLEFLTSSTQDAAGSSRGATMGLAPDPAGFGVHADLASFADDAKSS